MVSVIVPIYKVEAYLEKCIKSIQSQSYSDLEIILVDDGSPDNCGEICDSYAAEDNRIRVIHKENGGLSDARNTGIDIATGEYILFVDSDDYIHPQMVEVLLLHLQGTQADMAVCGFQNVTETEEVAFEDIKEQLLDSEGRMQGKVEIFEEQAIMNNLQDKNLLTVVAWNKLYKRELFQELRYPKGRIHEDEFLAHRILHMCKRTVYIKAELYYYLQRAGSIMGEVNYAGARDGWIAYKERLTFLQKHGYEEMVLFTKLHMLHCICKYYDKMMGKPEAESLLQEWRNTFEKIYEAEDVRSVLSKEQVKQYKYFVIKPQLYYNKKIRLEKREACVRKIKQTLKSFVRR